MAMTPYGGDPLVISKLGTTPQERGLSPEQFKGKFDEGLKAFAEWFNLTHKTEFEAKAEQADLEDLAGAERTIETVKGNADAIEAHEADYVRQPAFGSTGGAANTYTFSSNPPLPALVDGVSTYLDIHAANTGVSTLNWDGKGAKPIVTGKGAALTAGKLPLNGIVGVRYNASAGNFQLLGEGGDERQGDNAALALSISGTTLKLRAPAGLYDGVDDNVTHTDPNRKADNIKKGVMLDGLMGTLNAMSSISAGDNQVYLKAGAIPGMTPSYTNVSYNNTIFEENKTAIAGLKIYIPGTIRVSFAVGKTGTSTSWACGRIFVNQTAVGTFRQTKLLYSNGGERWTEDIPVNAGDTITVLTWLNEQSNSYYYGAVYFATTELIFVVQ